jgi:hypothetical protein
MAIEIPAPLRTITKKLTSLAVGRDMPPTEKG